MAYEIETRDGIVLRNIPDNVKPDDPRLQAMVREERMARRQRTPEYKAKAERDLAEDREKYNPADDTRFRVLGTDIELGGKGLGKTVANIGAGMDAAWQGLKQITPGVKSPTDDEVRAKRRHDEQLAEATQTGLGADWMPRAGKVLQFAGEVAPTLAIPAGTATGAASKILPRALQAMVSTPTRAGAVTGAAGGALMPTTSDESRIFNTVLGTAGGAVLPAALAAGGKVQDFFTGRGARLEAGRMLGATPDSPPAHPSTRATPGAENVRLSTAATYDDPALAALELASRGKGRSPGEWSNFDAAQRREVWENVLEGTRRAGTEGEARLQRAADYDTNAARVARGIKPKVWEREVAQLRQMLDVAARSPQGQNQMRPVIAEIARQMDELGPDFSPAHLAELRHRMAGKVGGSPDDPFRSAPHTDPAFISLKKEFDDILNAASGGRWEKVISGYREGSIPVAQAKAETMAQRRFISPEGTPRVTSSEGIPKVTENALRQAIAVPELKNVRGTAPTFAPESERVLKGTLAALERQNILQRSKQSTTGGGGSLTAPLEEAMKRMTRENVPAGNILIDAARWVSRMGDERALKELDRAMINPERYYEIIRETVAAGQPLSPAMEAVLRAASTIPGTGSVMGMQSRRDQQQPVR